MRSQFGALTRESDICVLCGEREAITGEHVPPKGLFRKLPNPYLTIPACKECNEGSTLDDEYLRQVMSATALVGEGRDVWTEKVVPKFQNRPGTQAGLRNAMTISEIETEQFGKFMAPQLMISEPRLRVSITKMVFGLHWFHTGNILPSTRRPILALIDAARGPATIVSKEFQAVSQGNLMGVYDSPATRETFFYTYTALPLASKWFFFFYKQTAVIAVTYPSRRRRK
jgi:hypothetical protein